MNKLREEDIKRQDFVDNTIFEIIQLLNPTQKEIKWDIEMIGEIRDCIEDWLTEHLKITDRMTFYPYMEE